MKTSGLIVAAALSSATGIAVAKDASDFDILGVKIGMTREQVEEIIKQNRPELTLSSTEVFREAPGIAPSSLAKLRFDSRSPSSYLILSFSPIGGIVYNIQRVEMLGDRDKPETWTSFKVLQEAFDQKYGPSTYVSKDESYTTTRTYYIVHNSEGNQVATEPCGSLFGAAGFRQTDKSCGVELSYHWTQGDNPARDPRYEGFASRLEFALGDFSIVNKEIEILLAKSEEAERQKDEQRESNAAPDL